MKTNLKQTTRHCEQSEAISSRLPRAAALAMTKVERLPRATALAMTKVERLPRATALAMTNETGRSMVEMLGVLAVIGVLSITGISGYNTAMNKHRVNEILDAASKRAVAVSTQIQRGNTSPTLGEFETNTVQGVVYGTPYKLGDNQFAIPLTWGTTDNPISSDLKTTLCKNMKQYISEDGEDATAQINTNCTRIVYNNDLSAGTSSSNNTNYDSSTQKCKTGYYGDDCENTCSKTHQIANEDNDGCVCENGYTLNNSTEKCEKTDCASDGYNSGSCPSGATCSTCLSGTDPYYKITQCSDATKAPNATGSKCVKSFTSCPNSALQYADGTCAGNVCTDNTNCAGCQKCSSGTCVDDSTKCTNQICKNAKCINDPCANVTCESNQTCVEGKCLGTTCESNCVYPGIDTTYCCADKPYCDIAGTMKCVASMTGKYCGDNSFCESGQTCDQGICRDLISDAQRSCYFQEYHYYDNPCTGDYPYCGSNGYCTDEIIGSLCIDNVGDYYCVNNKFVESLKGLTCGESDTTKVTCSDADLDCVGTEYSGAIPGRIEHGKCGTFTDNTGESCSKQSDCWGKGDAVYCVCSNETGTCNGTCQKGLSTNLACTNSGEFLYYDYCSCISGRCSF